MLLEQIIDSAPAPTSSLLTLEARISSYPLFSSTSQLLLYCRNLAVSLENAEVVRLLLSDPDLISSGLKSSRLLYEAMHLQCAEVAIELIGYSSAQTAAQQAAQTNKRRDLMLIAGLIEHPEMGLILFETQWGPVATDFFPRTRYEEIHHLPVAIERAGYNIKDVKAVIMGYLHLDHAGGLENFKHTAVPIYVHEEEFKYACWAAATGADGAVYLADYLSLDSLNWQTFSESQLNLCTGIILYHCPGHTPGLCIIQVNLKEDGTFICTTDQFHVRENYELNQAQGWLLRDHKAWHESGRFIKRLQKLFSAKLIFGHDYETAEGFIQQKKVYQ